MISHNYHFFLSEGKVLVSGAKNSVVVDFCSGRMYQVNTSAQQIIKGGEQGLSVGEVINLSPHIKAADILSFLENVSDQGLIQFSSNHNPWHLERPPFSLDFLWVEITSRCNLSCIHCYAEAGGLLCPPDPPLKELKRVLDEAAALGCKKLQFTGGEPTLRSDLKELVKYAKAKRFEFIEIFTNGTLLTESLVQVFSKEKINVAVSIYSYKKETHDTITRIPGSYQKTLDSLKLLLAYKVPTRCAVVAMKQNENDLKGTTYILSQLNLLNGPPDPIRPSGRGKGAKNWPQYGSFMQTSPTFFFNQQSYQKNRHWNSCWAGKAAVTSRGDVIPCVFARDHIAGNIKQQSLSDIIKGEQMRHFWELTKDYIEVCKDCEYRYVCRDCRPWAYGLTSNLYTKSPRCTYNPYTGQWEKAREPFDAGECIGVPLKK